MKTAYASETEHFQLLIQQAICISNYLHGNDVLSSQELAKGYTRPVIVGKLPVEIPHDFIKAPENSRAKRKITLILRSQSVKENPISVGDLIEVFLKNGKEKRGHWTNPMPVLSYDHTSRTVKVFGTKCKQMNAGIVYVESAIKGDELAKAIQ
eukprot:gb/GEZJ01004314.1/.p1 GENE.gb/GEZJ01004314.1/~~gb/GEZJ01004314.1/.p1  ORF type:complete len:153 (-),score=18.72 gb/GEZJ01004314.1/:413-871(-)